jgi:hypothetical protein
MILSADARGISPRPHFSPLFQKTNRVAALLGSVALFGFLASQNAEATGTCDPAFPAPGDTVTCSGDFHSTIYLWGDNIDVIFSEGSTIEPLGTYGEPGVVLNGDINSVTNNANIQTQGSYSEGFLVISNGGTTALNNGDISTNGMYSHGFGLYSGSYDEDSTLINNGTIHTQGDMSNGLYFLGYGYEYGDANGSAVNTGKITVEGDESSAIESSNFHLINNSGDLFVKGNDSFGINHEYLYHGMSETESSTVNNSGAINVGGARSYGIRATTNSNLEISNSGDIFLNNLSAGIFAIADSTYSPYSTGAAVTLNNSGDIVGNSEFSLGIIVVGTTGVSAVNSGDITTTHDAIGLGTIDGNVSLENSGNITAGSDGIDVRAGGTGQVVLTNSGDLTVHDIDDEVFGIKSLSEEESISLTNSGDIVSTGLTGIAIAAIAEQDVFIENSSSLTTNGTESTFINTPDNGYMYVDTSGIVARSFTGSVDVVNDGTITTNGDYGYGIRAWSETSTSFNNTGSIAATGMYSMGASIFSEGTVDVISEGGETSGDFRGLFAKSNWGTTVTTSSDLVANESEGVGLGARSEFGDTTINITNGTITGETGVSATSGNNRTTTILNSGTIIGTGGTAINTTYALNCRSSDLI